MKPEWVDIVPKTDKDPATRAMNVPGGCVLNYCGYMVIVHGIAVVKEDEAQGGGFRFVSTAAEDLDKALGPFRQLIALFKGIPGMPADPPAS